MQANDQPATAPDIAWSHFQICTPRVAHQTIDGETVIIDFETGAYYSTTRLGAEIWDHLAAGSTVDDILQATALRYAGNLPAMAAAIREFLGLLERESLIAPAHFDSESLPAAPAGPLPAERVPFEPPALHKFTDMADLLLLDPIHDVDESGWPTKKA